MPSNTSLIKDKRRKRTLSESFESVLFLFILRHRKLTNIFFGNDKKRGESQRKISEIRPKKSRSSVQILPKGLFWPFASFYLHPVFGYEKSPETLVGSGDFVCASFLYRHLGPKVWYGSESNTPKHIENTTFLRHGRTGFSINQRRNCHE